MDMNLFTIRRFTMYDWDYSVSNIVETDFQKSYFNRTS